MKQAKLYIHQRKMFEFYVYLFNEEIEQLNFQTENQALAYLCKEGYELTVTLVDGYWFVKP